MSIDADCATARAMQGILCSLFQTAEHHGMSRTAAKIMMAQAALAEDVLAIRAKDKRKKKV